MLPSPGGTFAIAALLGCACVTESPQLASRDSLSQEPRVLRVDSGVPEQLVTEVSCKPFQTSDPVTYGRIDVSPVSGDASGVDFTFQVVDKLLRGWVRDARGEVPPPRDLQDLQYDGQTDSLTILVRQRVRYALYLFPPRCL